MEKLTKQLQDISEALTVQSAKMEALIEEKARNEEKIRRMEQIIKTMRKETPTPTPTPALTRSKKKTTTHSKKRFF